MDKMSNNETVDYRLNAIDAKLIANDAKLDVIGSKLDVLKTDFIKATCAAPSTCLTLQVQHKAVIETLDKINDRCENFQDIVTRHDLEIDQLKTYQKIGLWALGLFGSSILFFGQQIQEVLKKVF